MNRFDSFFERRARRVAQATSRRGALAQVGRILVGSAFLLPVLPFDRISPSARAADGKSPSIDDPTHCDYWRHCALDGFICSCCGGTSSSCPPGTEVSKVTWVGTCHNPGEGKDYLISYNDCCGSTTCGRCACNHNVRERPGYRMGIHNDINWCMANTSNVYHCTVAVIVGVADPRG
jgi:methylamine dehydrogenase light chain